MAANSNYSFDTSLPAYKENQATAKRTQCDKILALIRKGADNLLQLAELSGLPQSTVAARMNDLVEEKKAKYNSKVVYKNRLRKQIELIDPQPEPEPVQGGLF